LPGHTKHFFAAVSGKNPAILLLSQHRPEPSGTAWKIKHDAGISGKRQCLASNRLFSPRRQFVEKARPMLAEVLLRIVEIVSYDLA
jgi:hypothetical protein